MTDTQTGSVRFEGVVKKNVTHLTATYRKVSMVFQS